MLIAGLFVMNKITSKYKPEEIKVALDAFYAMGDVPIATAAKKLNISQQTLAKWIKNPEFNSRILPPELAADHRKFIAKRLLKVADRILELTTDADIKKSPLQARFSALKVAVDIAQLLDGEPTSIRAEAISEEKRMELIMDMARRIESRRKREDEPKEIEFIEAPPPSVDVPTQDTPPAAE